MKRMSKLPEESEEDLQHWDKAYETYEEFVSGGIDTIQFKDKPGGEAVTIMEQGKILDKEKLKKYNEEQ